MPASAKYRFQKCLKTSFLMTVLESCATTDPHSNHHHIFVQFCWHSSGKLLSPPQWVAIGRSRHFSWTLSYKPGDFWKVFHAVRDMNSSPESSADSRSRNPHFLVNYSNHHTCLKLFFSLCSLKPFHFFRCSHSSATETLEKRLDNVRDMVTFQINVRDCNISCLTVAWSTLIDQYLIVSLNNMNNMKMYNSLEYK